MAMKKKVIVTSLSMLLGCSIGMIGTGILCDNKAIWISGIIMGIITGIWLIADKITEQHNNQ